MVILKYLIGVGIENMKNSYNLVKKFMNKFPMTIAWRVKKHCSVIDKHLNDGENVLYMFSVVVIQGAFLKNRKYILK